MSASSGADANAGTSDAAAFKTLQRAADAVRAGDAVVVRAGTYAAGMNLFGHAGGTAAAPIRFLADPGATITRSATAGTNATMAAINVESTGGWFVIDGFTITDANQTTQRAGIRLASSPHCVVRNNTIDGPYDGIFVSRSDDTLVEHNVCRNAYGEHGIYVNGSANYIVRGNECYGNPWNGIHTNVSDGVNQTNSGGLIEANLVHDNALAGFDFTGISDAVVRNNLVYGNGRHAVVLQNSNQNPTVACHDVTFVNNTLDARDGSSAWAIQMSAASAQPAGSTWSGNDNNVTVFNNVLMANAGSGNGSIGDLAGSVPTTLRSDYNVVVDGFRSSGTQRTLAAWRTATGNDADSVIGTASGLFVNPAAGDYHLKAAAPGIDRGAASFNGQTAPETDYDDEVRPQGSGFDPGCDEFRTGAGTPDTTAPTISAVAGINIASTSATITWRTDEAADTQVEYGPTTDYASSTGINAARATTHSQNLAGLSPSTTYHFRVKSRDAAGNLATSSDFTFTTAVADTAAPVISLVASSAVTATGARITWTTDEASTTQVEYGTTTSYGSSTTLAGSLVTSHAQTLSGLAPETLYHYRVKSRDAAGNLAVSADAAFTTAAAPATPPQVFSPVPYFGDFANYAALTASRWSVVDDGGDPRLFLNTTNYPELDDSRLGEMARPSGRGFGDFDLEVTARTGDDLSANAMADYAIVFGYADASNYTYLMMNATTGFTSFRAVVNGVQTVIGAATAPGIPDAGYHDVLVSRRGTAVAASVDGVRILAATNAKLGLAGGVGLGSFNDSAYFDDFNVVAPADTTSPSATSPAIPDVVAAGGAGTTFTVTYRDNAAVLASSIDGNDVLLSGPNGFKALASFVSIDSPGDGSPRVATYRISAPGGSWDYADNGTYTLSLLQGQVTDVSGNAAAATQLVTFTVNIPDTTPPVVGAPVVSDVAESAATVSWSTDEPTDAEVEYGTSASYGQRTVLDGSLGTSHAVLLNGLSPLTTYHYRVLSRDATGNLTTGADSTFTTTAATAPTPPTVGNVVPTATSSLPGEARDFTATYSDPNGCENIEWVYLRANADGPVMLDALYNVRTNKLYLRAEDGTTLLGGFTPGSPNVISNECGSLNCSAVLVGKNGCDVTVTWNVTAGTTLTGVNRVFVRAIDKAGLDSGYRQTSGATWTVNSGQAPSIASTEPAFASDAPGTPRTFSTIYSDPDGWANLNYVYLRVNTYLPTLLGAVYNVATNRLYLRNDSGTAVLGGFAPGSDHVISNANGSLNCAAVTVVKSGTDLTVNWNLTAGPVLAGNNELLTRALDRSGRDTGFSQLPGSGWTITGNAAPETVAVTPATSTDPVGTERQITGTYSDPDGRANLNAVFLTLNRDDPSRQIEVVYNVQNNRLYMKADDNVTLLGGFAPGSANVIRNSRGSLDCAATTITGAGNTLTVNWALRATSALVGTNPIWLRARDHGGADTFYQEQVGAEWIITPAPAM